MIGISTVSVGNAESTIVDPRDVFKPAILANATAVILAHNHPSGDLAPSPTDIEAARRILQAGSILNIAVLDSLIVTDEGRWRSVLHGTGGSVAGGAGD